MPRRFPLALLPAVIAAVALAAAAADARPNLVQQPATAMRGFSPAAAAAEHSVEEALAARLDRDSVRAFFRHFTDQPHPAGSARNYELAQFLAEKWKAYGLEQVQLRRYDVLLPWPREVRV